MPLPTHQDQANAPAISEDLVLQELQLRRDELEFRKQQDAHQYDIAKRAQTLNAESASDTRAKMVQDWREKRRLYLWLVLAAIIFCSISMYFGKEQVIFKIIEYGLAAVGGGGIGYWQGRKKSPEDPPND